MTVARLRSLAATVLVLAVLGGCGGDDPTVGESPSASPSPTATPASPNPGATGASPSTAAPGNLAGFLQPGLTEETLGILGSCLAGDDAACDRAQEPGRLEDGHFSRMTAACNTGNQDACRLRTRLVAAELRKHCAEGDAQACATPSP